jgi:hypothetical protein
MLKLINNTQKIIPACELKSGQLAIVVEGEYKGRIVQKYYNSIVSIGLSSGSGWSGSADSLLLKVRILEEGETLTVTNNE